MFQQRLIWTLALSGLLLMPVCAMSAPDNLLQSAQAADPKSEPVYFAKALGHFMIGPQRAYRRGTNFVLYFGRTTDLPKVAFWIQGRYVDMPMDGFAANVLKRPGEHYFPVVPAKMRFQLGQQTSEFFIRSEFVTNEMPTEAQGSARSEK